MGCPFRVAVEYSDGSNKVSISMHNVHEGHEPGTRADLYHLPVHPQAIASCMTDFFDVGTSRHVANMSTSKERFQIEQASPLDCVIYRFLKEVQMVAYQMRNESKCTPDDWDGMFMEALRLKEQGKVLYVQSYNPHATDEKDRPFVLIIQDQWMLHNAIWFSHDSAWAVDSTFKTNVFGLPLYATVVPNQLGVGMSIWLMMCTNDVGTSQESIALELTIRMILSRMNGV